MFTSWNGNHKSHRISGELMGWMCTWVIIAYKFVGQVYLIIEPCFVQARYNRHNWFWRGAGPQKKWTSFKLLNPLQKPQTFRQIWGGTSYSLQPLPLGYRSGFVYLVFDVCKRIIQPFGGGKKIHEHKWMKVPEQPGYFLWSLHPLDHECLWLAWGMWL